jgi:hypothetical protein
MSKKTFMATIIILGLLVSMLNGMQAVEMAKANVLFPTNLQISVISPTNRTYTSNSITLDINTTAIDPLEKEKTTQITYNLDRQGNQSTDNSHFWTTLADLSEGSHMLEVYAQNQYYNPQRYPLGPLTLRAYSIVYFTIDTSIPTHSATPSPTSSLKPVPHHPTIYIMSPSNDTIYETGDIPLTFTVTKPDSWETYVGISNIQYKLDPVFNGDFVTETSGWTDITPAQSMERTQQYSLILENASGGNHSLMVRVNVEYPGGYVTNGVYAFFSVIRAEPSPTKSPSLSPTDTPTPSQKQQPRPSEVLPLIESERIKENMAREIMFRNVAVILSAIMVMVAALVVAVFMLRRRR